MNRRWNSDSFWFIWCPWCEYFQFWKWMTLMRVFIYSSTILFFYPKWFEPSRLFGFHFFPPHLPTSGLSPSGQHIEVLEGGQEKETTWHFMVVSSWKSLEESSCRYDSSCHVQSLWVAQGGNFASPPQLPSQQWHVGPRWGLHGRQMWAPLWACTRDPHWGQPWKPRRTKSGTCKGTAWVLIGQFMSARFGPHLPKGVKSGFAPGIHMGASRGCPDGF